MEVKSGAETIDFSNVPSFNLGDYRVVEEAPRGLWHRTVISSGRMPVIKVDVLHPPLSVSSLHSTSLSGQVSIAEERSPPRRCRSYSPQRSRRSSTSPHQKEDEDGAGSRPHPSTDRDTSNQPNKHEAGDGEGGLDHTEGMTPINKRNNEKDSNSLVRPNASVDSSSNLSYDYNSSGSTDTRRPIHVDLSDMSLELIERPLNLYIQLSDIKGGLWAERITIITILGFLYLQFLGIFFGGAFAGRIVGPKVGVWTIVSAFVGTVQFSSSIGIEIVSVTTQLITSTTTTTTQQTQQQTHQQTHFNALVAATAAATRQQSALTAVAVTGTLSG